METATKYETDLNLEATELTLGLPGTDRSEKLASSTPRGSKRSLADAVEEVRCKSNPAGSAVDAGQTDRETAPVSKAQIVGWPPIRSYRINSFQGRKMEGETAGIYVKVSMDGAPYLRKIDLKVYKGYPELLRALGDMFKCFIKGEFSGQERHNGSEYVLTYEDKDGDWMLVGDVHWEMFISSCKRLRIMKGSEARGLDSGL